MQIAPLSSSPEILDRLAEILTAVVAGGGSVSFMHPLPLAKARRFWVDTFKKRRRVVLGAWADDTLAGTVTVVLDFPENQPHRAEIAKLMVAPPCRGRGIARGLMQAAEAVARGQGKTHLLLDTATEGGAAGLYESLGFAFVGEIPDFALKPHGGLTGTRLYCKRLV